MPLNLLHKDSVLDLRELHDAALAASNDKKNKHSHQDEAIDDWQGSSQDGVVMIPTTPEEEQEESNKTLDSKPSGLRSMVPDQIPQDRSQLEQVPAQGQDKSEHILGQPELDYFSEEDAFDRMKKKLDEEEEDDLISEASSALSFEHNDGLDYQQHRIMEYEMPSDTYESKGYKKKGTLYQVADKKIHKLQSSSRRNKKKKKRMQQQQLKKQEEENPWQNFVDNLPWNKDKKHHSRQKIVTIAEEVEDDDHSHSLGNDGDDDNMDGNNNLWADILVPEMAVGANTKAQKGHQQLDSDLVIFHTKDILELSSQHSGNSSVASSVTGPLPHHHRRIHGQKGILKRPDCDDDDFSLASGTSSIQTSGTQVSANRRSLFPRVPQYQVASSSSVTSRSIQQEQRRRKKKRIHFSTMARVILPQKHGSSAEEDEWLESDVWWQRSDYDEFKKVGELISRAVLSGDMSNVWLYHAEDEEKVHDFDIGDHQDELPGDAWWRAFGHSSRGLEHVVHVQDGQQRREQVDASIKTVLEVERKNRATTNSANMLVSEAPGSQPAPDDEKDQHWHDIRNAYVHKTRQAQERARQRGEQDAAVVANWTNDLEIQAQYRQYQKVQSQKRKEQRERELVAAIIIQAAQRRHEVRLSYQKQRKAIVRIQTFVRKCLAVDMFLFHQRAAIRIQAVVRRFLLFLYMTTDPVLYNYKRNISIQRIGPEDLYLMPVEEAEEESDSDISDEDESGDDEDDLRYWKTESGDDGEEPTAVEVEVESDGAMHGDRSGANTADEEDTCAVARVVAHEAISSGSENAELSDPPHDSEENKKDFLQNGEKEPIGDVGNDGIEEIPGLVISPSSDSTTDSVGILELTAEAPSIPHEEKTDDEPSHPMSSIDCDLQMHPNKDEKVAELSRELPDVSLLEKKTPIAAGSGCRSFILLLVLVVGAAVGWLCFEGVELSSDGITLELGSGRFTDHSAPPRYLFASRRLIDDPLVSRVLSPTCKEEVGDEMVRDPHEGDKRSELGKSKNTIDSETAREAIRSPAKGGQHDCPDSSVETLRVKGMNAVDDVKTENENKGENVASSRINVDSNQAAALEDHSHGKSQSLTTEQRKSIFCRGPFKRFCDQREQGSTDSERTNHDLAERTDSGDCNRGQGTEQDEPQEHTAYHTRRW
eukprot:CAMPEP_0172447218 /NCGR_PEP_ID=MMETSP1065-20121228/6569_1 /TAXON_ID=265537 /ORGANISM="Amphiprora paludosa, Strain CCMP125" /LENGTH=1158 /DNA_ID=CAMNT_0013198461 /DNA_START=107 /DNA_END=3580 /DNA_ORIENTATION=+